MRAVIFDVDGTLVDTVDFHAMAWQEAFAAAGHQLGYDDIRSQIGKGGDQLMPVFLSPTELDQKGKAIEQHRKSILQTKYLPHVSGFSGSRPLIEKLRADNIRVILASSGKPDELEIYKKAARIEDLVEDQTTSADAESSKPDPDIFQAALNRLNCAPQDAIVVGDTPYDAEAATKAGLRTIGVLCGGFSEQSLRDAGCIAVHEGPAGLLARYDSLPFKL